MSGFWQDGAGSFLHGLLHPEPKPGPPFTHTIVQPEPIGEDEDGNPLYPEPGPAMTLADFDRMTDEVARESRHIDPYCPCAACSSPAAS